MSNSAFLTPVVAAMALLSTSPVHSASQNNWGQEVKACNQSACYPGGTSRGVYVRQQAKDDQGPGYGFEIQTLASPGNGNGPKSDKF